ncbi:hypothetical protein FDENT_4519 [Fusarium denticulatum]|uniref:Uncharacterized protein n=1 Tax=Fusarium denticulatum TaxID=48507 RepID=A0A8H5UET3_9HYPO|nr:hypothetical protein FDENT_4519 [Fusarium denticulatum]
MSLSERIQWQPPKPNSVLENFERRCRHAKAQPFLADKPMNDTAAACAWENFRRPLLGHFASYKRIDFIKLLGYGQDGIVWEVVIDSQTYALKVFWDNQPPEGTRFWAFQRECQNASLLAKMRFAIDSSSDPVWLNPNPTSFHDAASNLHAFSDKGRSRQVYRKMQGAAEYCNAPRLRECYGWTSINGKELCTMPSVLHPPEVRSGDEIRNIWPTEEYHAIVYEYVPSSDVGLDADVVQAQLDFLWLGGWCLVPLQPANWGGVGILLDMGDPICLWHTGWFKMGQLSRSTIPAKAKIDFERHLSDHAEQRRIRKRMIGDLQVEALKHEAHADANDGSSSESDTDQESDGENEDASIFARPRRPSPALICPSCPRSEPFDTMQKLRRHHEQGIPLCFGNRIEANSGDLHAENCVGDSERKRAYMDETCKELTILSDAKLERGLRESKQRSRGESEQAASSVECARRNPRAQKRRRTRQQDADDATDGPNLLPSYTAPTDSDPYLDRSSGAPAAPANVHIQNQTQGLSTEATEAVVPSLDVLENFDAPLMHIMNSVPLDIYAWPVDAYDGNLSSNEPSAYRLSPSFVMEST